MTKQLHEVRKQRRKKETGFTPSITHSAVGNMDTEEKKTDKNSLPPGVNILVEEILG